MGDASTRYDSWGRGADFWEQLCSTIDVGRVAREQKERRVYGLQAPSCTLGGPHRYAAQTYGHIMKLASYCLYRFVFFFVADRWFPNVELADEKFIFRK